MTGDVTIEYGETDQDCIDTHLFLCVVGGSSLLAPIDPNDSIAGIMEVRDSGIFLIARKDGHIVGTIGLVKVKWWYSKELFFTNRWYSVFPQFKHTGVGAQLLGEVAAIGVLLETKVVIVSHTRKRKSASGAEPYFVRDVVL